MITTLNNDRNLQQHNFGGWFTLVLEGKRIMERGTHNELLVTGVTQWQETLRWVATNDHVILTGGKDPMVLQCRVSEIIRIRSRLPSDAVKG